MIEHLALDGITMATKVVGTKLRTSKRLSSRNKPPEATNLKPPPPPPSPPSGAVSPNVAKTPATEVNTPKRTPPPGPPRAQHPSSTPGKELKKIPEQPLKKIPANPVLPRHGVETIPEGDKKPAAVETPSPTQPDIGERIPWSEIAPPTTTPNSNSNNVVQNLQPCFEWNIQPEELSFIQAGTLNFKFLTGPIPRGLGFSKSCKVWLDILNINTWKDLVSSSPFLDVHNTMKELTVPTYHKYCSDIRKVICFGKLCKKMNPNSPSPRRRKRWIHKYKDIISSELRGFPPQEQRYATFLMDHQQTPGQPVVQGQNTFQKAQNNKNNNPTPGVPRTASKPNPPNEINVPQGHVDGGDKDWKNLSSMSGTSRKSNNSKKNNSKNSKKSKRSRNSKSSKRNHEKTSRNKKSSNNRSSRPQQNPDDDPSDYSSFPSDPSDSSFNTEDGSEDYDDYGSDHPSEETDLDYSVEEEENPDIDPNPMNGRNLEWRDNTRNNRGADFPAYGQDVHVDRIRRLTNSDPAYTPSDFLKQNFSQKHQWDGKMETFKEFKSHIEGFYIQNRAWFMFNPKFQKLYVKLGSDCVDHQEMPMTINCTKAMIIQASNHLFGVIQVTTRKASTVKLYLDKYRATLDGILVWVRILREKDNDGNKEVRIENLLAESEKPLTSKYPGGLLQYIHDLEGTYSELKLLGEIVSEKKKRRDLLTNLTNSNIPNTEYLSHHCRENYKSFQQCITHLRKYASRKKSSDLKNSIRQARLVETEGNDQEKENVEHSMDDLHDICVHFGHEPTYDNMRMVHNLVTSKTTSIPPEAWKIMVAAYGPDVKKFTQARKEHHEKLKKDTPDTSSTARPNMNQPPIRREQYDLSQRQASANLATSNEDSESESENEDRRILQTLSVLYPDRQINMVKTNRNILHNTISTSSANTIEYHKLIFDTGADTSVIGKGWRILQFYGPSISLIGFDSKHARKKDLRLCTAETIVEHPSGSKHLVRIHQAVYNPTATSTLLSEYQLSEFGCKIDTKPKYHTYPNGEQGSQSFTLPESSKSWIFDIDSCLMTLPHRMPSWEESETLEPEDITSMAQWNPGDHESQDNISPYLVSKTIPIDGESQNSNVNVLKNEGTCAIIDTIDTKGESQTLETIIEGNEDTIFHDVTIPENIPKDSDKFLSSMKEFQLPKEENPYDVASYLRLAYKMSRVVKPRRAKTNNFDFKAIQPCLAYLPIDSIKRTFDCTTQLAKWHTKVPLQKHWQPRFPFLNVHRLSEPVATDTIFANTRALGGDTCAQIFFGIQSHMINVYPMKAEKEGPEAYEDFIREEGCPTILRRDNSKMQSGEDFTRISRHFCVKDTFTEAGYQHQNPVENQAIRYLKARSQTVMNASGAPEFVWPDCLKWIAEIHNITADEQLKYRTPYEKRHGSTPDISAYILFTFWEKILYHEPDNKFPDAKELPGYFLGIARNVGDTLTFIILSENHTKINRSVIRSASGKPMSGFPNLRLKHIEYTDEPPEPVELITLEPKSSENPSQDHGGVEQTIFTPNNQDPVRNKTSEEQIPDRSGNAEVDNKEKNQITTELDTSNPSVPESTNGESENSDVLERKTKQDDKKTSTASAVPIRNVEQSQPSNRDSRLKFSLSPVPVTKTNFKKFPKKTKKPRKAPTRKSSRLAKGKMVQTGTDFWNLLKYFVSLGAILISTTPIIEQNENISKKLRETLEKLAEQNIRKEEIPEIDDTNPKIRRLRYYHHILDQLKEKEDTEDQYQSYVWKVDKIISTTRRKNKIFLHVQWIQGNRTWISLNSLRLHDPYSCVLYAVEKKLVSEPDWEWTKDYINDTKEYTRLIRVLKTSQSMGGKYKFGVEIPRSVKHALEIDRRNGNNLWKEAMEKELAQLDEYQVFRLRKPGESIQEYERLPYHLVWDCKFDYRRKCRVVLQGDKQMSETDQSYSGVVSLTTVRIMFLLATIGKLKLWAADIGNAFLNGYTRDKLYIVAGPEFGPEREGKELILYKSMYGARASCARFHESLAVKLLKMGYKPSKADPDLWFKDLGTHYEYIATYIDDLLVCSKNPEKIMKEFEETYILKGVGIPSYYLGADIVEASELEAWKMEPIDWMISSKTYSTNMIKKFEELMSDGRPQYAFPEYKTPMDVEYHPEMDETALINAEMHTRYRSMIGSLNWLISIGRFDIQFSTTLMARYGHAPREGHLKAVIRILGYVKKFNKAKLVIDPTMPPHENYPYDDLNNWHDLYPDSLLEIPYDAPKPKGPPVRITIWVDADHARDKLTCRSVTGILVMINNTVVKTFSKRQTTVESSTYGSELVAARIATDIAVELTYNLQMIGVPLDGSVLMLGDNKSVVLNTTIPSSTLKKKHNAIAYHRVREAIAARIIRFCHIDTQVNIADVLTKPLVGPTFHQLIAPLLFRNPGEERWPKPVNTDAKLSHQDSKRVTVSQE